MMLNLLESEWAGTEWRWVSTDSIEIYHIDEDPETGRLMVYGRKESKHAE